ncbi:unnamed protein product [Lactuca saligna]|uniref:Uncharacterized protein n=1 Tax=Lactuca saligna TaxID=75948 RepID=A0AA35VCG1_LACSI|nr:unnamed protein product [Lactuca saligna]
MMMDSRACGYNNVCSLDESDYEHMDPSREDACKNAWLEVCSYVVVIYSIYSDNECWKKRLPLSNGSELLNVKSFVKYLIGDPPLQNPLLQSPPRLPGEKKDRRSLIVLLGTSVFVIFVLN